MEIALHKPTDPSPYGDDTSKEVPFDMFRTVEA